MSRRYGRNQKRKHVARIQELEADYVNMQADFLRMTRLWRSSVEEKENLRRQLEIVVSAVNKVCKNSGCVEAQHVPGLRANDTIRVPVWEKLKLTASFGESPAIDTMSRKVVNLYKLALSVDKYTADLSTRIHLRAGELGSVYYYASKELLQDLSDVVVEELSKDIAKLFVKELRAKERI